MFSELFGKPPSKIIGFLVFPRFFAISGQNIGFPEVFCNFRPKYWFSLGVLAIRARKNWFSRGFLGLCAKTLGKTNFFKPKLQKDSGKPIIWIEIAKNIGKTKKNNYLEGGLPKTSEILVFLVFFVFLVFPRFFAISI